MTSAEIAKDILVAMIGKVPLTSDAKEAAQEVGQAYQIIYDSVKHADQGPSNANVTSYKR